MSHNIQDLARRERQILEIVYSLGRATAAEVHQQLADPPSYSTVRKVLSILEEKGHIRHTEQDRRYVYLPTKPKRKVQSSALQQLMDSLFENSAESVVSTLMDISARKMSADDLERLAQIIDRHRKERQ
jgi:predicted transcriptional regulator